MGQAAVKLKVKIPSAIIYKLIAFANSRLIIAPIGFPRLRAKPI